MRMDSDGWLVFGILGVGALILLWISVLVPAGPARRRGRSALFWVLVSLVTTPLVAIPMLLVLGDAGRRA